MEIPHSAPTAQSRAQQHSGLFMTSVEQRHDENHWKHLCSPSYFSCSPPVTMLIRITTFQAWSAGLFTRWACKNIPCRYVKCFLWWVWLKYWKWTLLFRESWVIKRKRSHASFQASAAKMLSAQFHGTNKMFKFNNYVCLSHIYI